MTRLPSYCDAPINEDLDSMIEILRHKRPHKSRTEREFARKFLDVIPGMQQDAFGNRILKIKGDGDNILWSCHIDTVHNDAGTQLLMVSNGFIRLDPRSGSNCLGADDGAGVWLLLEMIKAGKPGLYIFHRGEECGALGSSFIRKHTPELLDGMDAAVAFDRYGYNSVITHQCYRTASDEFAISFALALGYGNMEPDPTGIFTDTAEYEGIIGECTNVSVGYDGHHTSREVLNYEFLINLRDAILELDTSQLVFKRQPGDYDYDDWPGVYRSPSTTKTFTEYDSDEYKGYEAEYMMRILQDHPLEAAIALQGLGLDYETLKEAVDYIYESTNKEYYQ